MRNAVILLLALPFIPACIPQEPPVSAPVADEAPPPAERVVVSTVTVPSAGDAPAAAGDDAALRADALRLRHDPQFFRIGAGYGAVGQVDLASCRLRGLDPGYVHMHVTFDVGGRVARASVESFAQPSSDALACIGEHLGAASVPPFEGGDVTLSKSLFVPAAVEGPEVFVKRDVARSGAKPLALAP